MATMDDSAKAGYDGSRAGGKFRKRPFRRQHQTTPYDRPPTALRKPNGWLSRIVDPASKLITAGAHKLFSSVFRKRLLPPPQLPPDDNEEPRDNQLETVPAGNGSGGLKQNGAEANYLGTTTAHDGVSELEHLLKQKTFTRLEIDRLTALLHSRTIDKSSGAENERSGLKLSDPSEVHTSCGELIHGPVEEGGTEPHALLSGGVWTPSMRSKLLDEDIASPAEIAKAYMGGRPTKVPPSMLGLRSQAQKEDGPARSGPFHLQLPNLSVFQKPLNSSEISGNGFAMPRSRGRSAIYCMPCTPYSRIHKNLTIQGNGSAFNARPSSSLSSQNAAETYQFNEPKKLVLKRRSSMLDNDIGSVGPIRRIRQKPNLSSKILSLPTSAVHHIAGSDVTEIPHSLANSPHSYFVSKSQANGADRGMPVIDSVHVSSKSIEMGQRILQQLDKISPKGKSAERNLGNVIGKTPAKMTPGMLHGQACKSLETVDSFKFLQSVQDNDVADFSLDAANNASVSSSKKGEKDEDDNREAFTIPYNKLAPENSLGTGFLSKGSLHTSKATNSAMLELPLDPPQKKRAFQISAREDYLDLDDDVHSNGVASTSLSERRQSLAIPALQGKGTDALDNPPLDEMISVEQPAVVPDPKPPHGSSLDKNKEAEQTLDGLSVVGKSISFSFPVASASLPVVGMSVQEAAIAPQTLESNRVVPTKQLNSFVPAFSVPLKKSSDKVSPFTFSAPSSDLRDSEPECSTSFATVASAPHEVPKLHGLGNASALDAVDVIRMEENTSSLIARGLGTTTSGLSSQMPGSNPSPDNQTASAFSHALISSSSTNQNLSNGFTQSASTSTATNITTVAMSNLKSASDAINGGATASAANSRSLLTTASAPSFSTTPIFKFGSPAVSATLPLPEFANSGAESTDSVAKSKETGLGNQSGSFFGVPPSATASAGNGTSGFYASTTSDCGSQPQTTPGAGSGVSFGVQASSVEGTLATSTQSMLTQFAVPTSSPTFGPSGSTTFCSGSSLFGSSAPASTQFTSDVTSGSSSLESSSKFTSMSSTNGAGGMDVFGSTRQPSKIPAFGPAFNSTPSTVFAFGASSGSAPGSESPSNMFGSIGSSAAPLFSFSSATPASSTTFTASQPSFGSSNPVISFGLTPSANNNDQMNMDSMAEDSIQPSPASVVPAFGQSPIAAPSSTGFVFGATTPSGGNPFQFSSQPNQLLASQNASPFQSSGSLDAAGSFSLGTGGTDKSARKIIKVKGRHRKK
ncbi:hypothetical protein Ancab_012638 [Ancistrocladus abbreviatus]